MWPQHIQSKSVAVNDFQELSISDESGSGPGGRRFESSRPDHSSKLALVKITTTGLLHLVVITCCIDPDVPNIGFLQSGAGKRP
jgi:hypothetical protein